MRKKGLLPLILGFLLLTVFALSAFAPGLFTGYGQKELFTKWLPISREHLLGTNAMGYDIFTELVYGARQTLLVGVLSSILTLILGAGIGILGSFRGWIGQIFNGLIQIFVLLPKLITLIVLATFFGSSAAHLIILIAAFSWVGTARAVRAKVLQLHTQPFIESCRILGYSRAHIAVRAHPAEPVGCAALALSARGEQLHYDGVNALVFGAWRSLSPDVGHDGQFCV